MDKKKKLDELRNKLSKLEVILNGGLGSRNHGHAGRPGKVGGSGKGYTYFSKPKSSFSKDSTSEDLNTVIGNLAIELRNKCEEIKDGAKTDLDLELSKAFGEDISNAIKTTAEQNKKLADCEDEYHKLVAEIESDYHKAKGDKVLEPGYYLYQGNVFEVTGKWEKREEKEVQVMFAVDAAKNRDNTYEVWQDDIDKMEKVSISEATKSIEPGSTLNGISKDEERIIKTYTYASAQNNDLRAGKDINEIPSAKKLKDVIDRTNSVAGTFYRGLRGPGAKESISGLKVGDVYEDKGFMSTDYDLDVAKKFAESKVLLVIDSKGGFGKSLSLSPYTIHTEETEMLFNAGTKMKIKEITKDGEYDVYKMEVL